MGAIVDATVPPAEFALEDTFEAVRERGIAFQVRRVVGLSDPVGDGGTPLTEAQQEALAAAFETDYYGVPRELTQEGLADELCVSHQALSERLRRGHGILVERSLATGSTLAADRP